MAILGVISANSSLLATKTQRWKLPIDWFFLGKKQKKTGTDS
jgi:hypothetical protein